MQKFADPRNADYGKTDYYEDPSALKLISQTEWDVRSPHTLTLTLCTWSQISRLVLASVQLDRPLYDVANQNQPVAAQRVGYFVRSQRTRNYIRCAACH